MPATQDICLLIVIFSGTISNSLGSGIVDKAGCCRYVSLPREIQGPSDSKEVVARVVHESPLV